MSPKRGNSSAAAGSGKKGSGDKLWEGSEKKMEEEGKLIVRFN